jgi:chorismate synthase
MLRYVTAGESHGKELTVILEGIPAGLKISAQDINTELKRRQRGFGRGERMKIESDTVEFTSGVRLGETIGSPICMVIKNRDWENWSGLMAAEPGGIDLKSMETKPRPGHADLAGALKFNRRDIRDILERASARETAARVAAGAVCKKLLGVFDIGVYSYVKEIGQVKIKENLLENKDLWSVVENSELRSPDSGAEKIMKGVIQRAAQRGDTVGGIFALIVKGVPAGLGSHTQGDLKLDGQIAQALMSIQAIKAVEIGLGFELARMPGSEAHDEIQYSKARGFFRDTNHAGGIEGGITNGQDLLVSCAMKPIPSLKRPLLSVDIKTKKTLKAQAVRSDVCAVPAASIVGESAISFVVAKNFKEKFGGDSMLEMKRNYNGYLDQLKEF